MERFNIPVLAEIDTRALVRHLRDRGVMRGVISTSRPIRRSWSRRRGRFRRWMGPTWRRWFRPSSVTYWTSRASARTSRRKCVGVKDAPPQHHVVAYDFGIKQNILRMLVAEGCRVTVVPAETTAEDVLALKPDGVFLSNGPGDPEPVDYAVNDIRD